MIIEGGGRAVGIPSSTPAITIASTPSLYFERGRADERLTEYDINRIIELYAGSKDHRTLARDPLYQNMEYIRTHPPTTIAEQEKSTNDILNGILDAISYATAIASFVPFPPLQIGGMLGYTATNAARQFSNGNTYGGLRNLNQMSRTIYNMRRQNQVHSAKIRYYGKNR